MNDIKKIEWLKASLVVVCVAVVVVAIMVGFDMLPPSDLHFSRE